MARPDALTDTTLLSELVHVTGDVDTPLTVSVCVSPARRTMRGAVIWSDPLGDVGVLEELSHPASRKANTMNAAAEKRDVTPRL